MNELASKNILICYHANCIDGFTSAWVTYNAVKDMGAKDIELMPMSYGKDNREVSNGEKILLNSLKASHYKELFIVDFSLSEYCLNTIATRHNSLEVTLLDHHKTAFERYFPNEPYKIGMSAKRTRLGCNIILDDNESGASLCWKYFNSTLPMPILISYVRDYDLWLFDHGVDTKYVNKFLRTREMSMSVWDDVNFNIETEDGLQFILRDGQRMQHTHDKTVTDIAADANECSIVGLLGLAVECPVEFTSDVGNTLAKLCGTYGAMYRFNIEKSKVEWSLRGVPGMDVSFIAKRFGGGGHEGAAGFEIAMFPIMDIINGGGEV